MHTSDVREGEHVNVTMRKGRVNLTGKREAVLDGVQVDEQFSPDNADKISVVGSVSDVTPPPPPPPPSSYPQINPFTPEWFAQVIGAAAPAGDCRGQHFASSACCSKLISSMLTQ